MLPVFLDCSFLIAPSVFSKVYLYNSQHLSRFCKSQCFSLQVIYKKNAYQLIKDLRTCSSFFFFINFYLLEKNRSRGNVPLF